MEKFTVVFHPCESIHNYVNNTHSYSPLYTHHFFNQQENWSAVQWVRYDVYYIVDTFELFIKVSGQLYMSKDDNDIRKGLYLVYKSIFSTLPDYTLVLEESQFKNMLYMRSMGSENYIPPGRILVEIPLDDSSVFQLRYCVFQEESYTSNNLNNGHYSSRSDKRSTYDSSNSNEMTDKSIYFKYTPDKDSLDQDVYDECYMNISHKGNFDNCLIYDIIKLVNKNKKEKPKSPRKSQSNYYDRLNYAVQDNFNILHRRLEWFYHWFIEGASNIKTDSRWSIFIPLIIYDYASNGYSRLSCSDYSLNNKNNSNHLNSNGTNGMNKRNGTKLININPTNHNSNHYNNNNHNNTNLNNRLNNHYLDHVLDNHNRIASILTSNEEFKKSISNRLDNTNVESLRNTIMNEPLGVISDLVDFKSRRSPTSKKSNYTSTNSNHSNNLNHNNNNHHNNSNHYKVAIVGMVTAYYFFTLNKDRLRISQFMIYPNYNGKGFGLWVLEYIYRFGIMDSHVREITVEDPTSAFLVLRYVVALKLCFESGLVDTNILYANNKSSLGLFKLFTKDCSIPSRDHISSICKESKSHSTRLVEILQLASILPNPISTEFFVSMLSNKRPKANNIDVKLSIFIQSDLYMDYWDKLKNKLKEEELKSSGKSTNLNKLSPNKYMNSMETFLDNMCNQTISGYIRVINKLRKMFPKK